MTRANAVPLAGSAAILIAALLLGSVSCEPGAATGYLVTGAMVLLLCLVAPFLPGGPVAGRGRAALRGALICGIVWILGIVLGGFRVMCRLF